MASKFFYLLALIASTLSSPVEKVPETAQRNTRDVEYRLPADAIEVINYAIVLNLGTDLFDTNQFSGVAEVLFTNLKQTNEVKIHGNRLNFTDVYMVNQDGDEIPFQNTEFEIDDVTDILTLTTTQTLEAGASYQIRFNYTAELRTNEMYGLYRSSYTAPNGSTTYLATTQFQTTHARKVFPCFDEPLYKAEFDIRIRHPREYNALGNTQGSSYADDSDADYRITVFQPTPRMSTYLIAFVISDFTCTSGAPIEEGIPHSICSREEAAADRALAVDVGPKIAWALEDFTGVKYSESRIRKIHQAAIPDFSAGAMENWGLVTYRERYLLWDPQESSNRYKQYVETIIAHELAHFWFGNLVTCHWWSDTFLNEGFATYFEYFATHEVEPDWELDKQFVIDQLQPVLVNDASISSAALSSPASSPTEISGRFSSISYNKGGSIFRMVRHFLGLENFKNGINAYLEANKFTAVTPVSLLAAWESFRPSQITINIPTIMENWFEKAGFPIITVTTQGRNLVLTQKRFLTTNAPDNTTWYVPISYTTSSDSNKFQETSAQIWLPPSSTEQIFTNILQNEDDWVILNNQQTGYYRVDYSDDLWTKIRTALNEPGFDGIHELNRAQLVDDIFNYARYGYRSFAEVLQLYEFLRKDTSYFSWYSAFAAFNNMILRIGDERLRTIFSAYLLDLIEVVYNSVPFNENKDENQIYTHTKVLIVPWACRLGLKDCIDNALSAFATYRTSNIKPNKNMRSVVYCNGLRHSQNITDDWQFLWNEFLTTQLSTEEVTILSALGCATDETILKDYLSKSIDSNSGIRPQDALSVFAAVYNGNPEGVDVAFDFVVENFDAVAAYYGSMNSINSIFTNLANRFTTQEQIDKFENFINDANLGEHVTAANTALNIAKNNLVWIEQFEQEMNLYFTPREEDDLSTAGVISAGFITMFTSLVLVCYQLFF